MGLPDFGAVVTSSRRRSSLGSFDELSDGFGKYTQIRDDRLGKCLWVGGFVGLEVPRTGANVLHSGQVVLELAHPVTLTSPRRSRALGPACGHVRALNRWHPAAR